MEQAMMLFAPDNNNDEEDDEEEEDNNVGNSLKEEELMAILPDLVIAFDAEDEFLMNRVLNLAEKNVANSRYSEENMRSRLGFYRYFFLNNLSLHLKSTRAQYVVSIF